MAKPAWRYLKRKRVEPVAEPARPDMHHQPETRPRHERTALRLAGKVSDRFSWRLAAVECLYLVALLIAVPLGPVPLAIAVVAVVVLANLARSFLDAKS